MNKDIVPELLEKIISAFDRKNSGSKKIRKLKDRLNNDDITYNDAYDYARELGKNLADSLSENITKDILPDEKMYYNIADRIVKERLDNNYELISDFSMEVQQRLNNLSGLNIKAIKPDSLEEKTKSIINKLTSDKFEKVNWVLDAPIRHHAMSVVDSTVKNNVEFQSKLGLKLKVVRKLNGETCKWCIAVAGTYEYPNVPKDVYRRHDNCDCTVEYFPGDGKIQNVHTKVYYNSENEALDNFRKKQINDIINSKEEKKKKEVEKLKRILSSELLGKEINNVKITNITYHMAERAVDREIGYKDILDSIDNPLKISGIKYDSEQRPSFKVIGAKSTVTINPENGNMVTAHKTHSKLIKKIKRELDENNTK